MTVSRLLRGLGAKLAAGLDVRALHGDILDAAVTLMHADFATLRRCCPGRGGAGELRLLASRTFGLAARQARGPLAADAGVTCGEALRTGERAIARDVASCGFLGGADRGAYADVGVRAAQSTPLVALRGSTAGGHSGSQQGFGRCGVPEKGGDGGPGTGCDPFVEGTHRCPSAGLRSEHARFHGTEGTPDAHSAQ